MRPRLSPRLVLTVLLLGMVAGGVAWMVWRSLMPVTVWRNSPDEVRFITSDIPNFWQAFDLAQSGNAERAFELEYLDKGSPGLRDFIPRRIQSAANLAEQVRKYPNYLRAIRANTLALEQNTTIQQTVRRHFNRLKQLHPPAQFQDVYFVMGAFNSGGTASPNGLLMGLEMFARSPDTPVNELTPWLRANTGSFADLPFLITHEAIHALQDLAGTGGDSGKTLLWKALQEGGADFVASLASSQPPYSPYFRYGLEHEAQLWPEFVAEMNGTKLDNWLYNGGMSTDRPADLGYFIGYRILEAFYQQATDKTKAMAELLTIKNPVAILEASGYGKRF